MKVYLFVSNQKLSLPMYGPYRELLEANLNITASIDEADVMLILGAWTAKGARLARKSRRMGIPYIVCPLGDISDRNCKNPYLKRSLQWKSYQWNVMSHASIILATTPQEKYHLERKMGNKNVRLVRYFAYSHLTSREAMIDDFYEQNYVALSVHEKEKAKAISLQTSDVIAAQLLQIKSRMPHRNIPQHYLDELHSLLYADNYDEDALCKELNRLKLSAFAASVFQVMTEKTGLTEGFMPLSAKKGGKSKTILKYVR